MHKKIGIIGGLSAESTAAYYLHITRKYIELFGDCAYPEIIIFSVNLENYHKWRNIDRWDLIIEDLIKAATSLESAGADFLIIATNTMHKVYKEVERAIALPLIHILDPVIVKIKEKSFSTVGVLGTLFTMQDTFYKERLIENGIKPLVPSANDQEIIHQIITEKLVKGKIDQKSRDECVRIINALVSMGAECAILGCTELPLLIKSEDTEVIIFDTLVLHAEAALQLGLAGAFEQKLSVSHSRVHPKP